MKKSALLCILGLSTFCAGCDMSLDDAVISPGLEGGLPALYVTFKKTPSAQLLLLLKAVCGDKGGCVLDFMKQKKPNFDVHGFGQAEYDVALDGGHANDIRNAISGVQSVNVPVGCVRLKMWKSYNFPWGIDTHAKWSHTHANCEPGGNILD